ncbi:MAM and LDL-receptor class A domain-containing protein 1-like [Dreissena polymorpha]|uniref:MAM and LDL-receptor class A domain-containing protein 1-like n=1 Tax=Dreissena polymorpha TaxID=45954 RepID=UPI002263CD67|nr:MAM and LDL-receptor class A domain-containing protein 1-like [Dreissena polymorpha]
MPKRTEANHNTDHKRFLLDSLNQAQCNFDVNSFCSWRNVHGLDDFDWVLYGSSTPTDDTGPDFDHTTRNSSGSYIFTESSAPRNLFDTAWIKSPTIEVTSDPVHCFRFWYHMYGSSIGRLNVYQVTNGGLPGKVVWSLTGDQGNSWKEGQVPLNSNQSYSILLSGVIGNGYQGDIAVDDINVSVGYCEVKPSSASRTDVTNTTTTPDPQINATEMTPLIVDPTHLTTKSTTHMTSQTTTHLMTTSTTTKPSTSTSTTKATTLTPKTTTIVTTTSTKSTFVTQTITKPLPTTTTMDPVFISFCEYKHIIECPDEGTPVCGTNRIKYSNE